MESIIWSNGRIRKLSIFMFWIPKQPLDLDVSKETLHYCLKSKRFYELCRLFHKTLYWNNWSAHSPSSPQISARNTHHVLDTLTLKKQQSPKQRADEEAKGNTALVSSAVRSTGRHFFFLPPCFPLPYLLLDLWEGLVTGLAGPNSHPDLEAGTGRAELALPEHCYLEVAPLTTTDLFLKCQTQHKNRWLWGQPEKSCFYGSE